MYAQASPFRSARSLRSAGALASLALAGALLLAVTLPAGALAAGATARRPAPHFAASFSARMHVRTRAHTPVRHPAVKRPATAHAIVCQARRGHTVFRSTAVRVFAEDGKVWGCVNGSASAWELWTPGAGAAMSRSAAVRQAAGPYVAVEKVAGGPAPVKRSLAVTDLATGSIYVAAHLEAAAAGAVLSAEPATPGPWPLEGFVLASDGNVARLYSTFQPGAGPGAPVTGQVLELVGPQGLHRVLASSAQGSIASASLVCSGSTVRWTQAGQLESAGD